MRFLRSLSMSFLGIAIATAAQAQMSANPPEIGAKIRAMGTTFNRDVIIGTNKLYGPLMKTMPRDGVTVTRDRAYGSHARHKLDVYRPATSAGAAPVVVFLHGGGYVRGDKKGYANVGTYFARHGIVGIAANYSLAPEAKWPAGAEDIAAMIEWIKANGAEIGGDPKKIFLMGSSAGAGHVASYVFHEENQIKDDGVAGAIFLSLPTFNLETRNKLTPEGVLAHPGERGYFGAEPEKYASMSSINAVAGRKISLFVAYAELDMPMVHDQNAQLIDAIYERDKMLPAIKQAQGHNHLSITRHLNTKDVLLGLDLIEFVRTH